MTWDLLLKGARLVDSTLDEQWDLAINGGRIAAVGPSLQPAMARETVELNGLHIFPGVIDPHVHYGYAGPLDEQFRSETGSAALGGVTSILLFHRDATDYSDSIPHLIQVGEREALIDFGVHAGIVSAAQAARIPELAAAGIASFKFYMAYQGSDNQTAAGFPTNAMNDALMFECFQTIARLGGVACAHCENPSMLARAREIVGDRDGLAAWHTSRPGVAEAEAVVRAAFFAQQANCRLYIVHLSSREGLDAARQVKQHYGGITVETCPHYLTLTSDAPVGNQAKVSPSIKGLGDLEALWTGISEGTIESMGTDHCPVPAALKQGSIWDATPGFPGSGLLLPLLLHEGHHKRGLSLSRIATMTSAVPARQFGLWPRKGSLRPGADADLVVVDLNREETITPERQGSSAMYSPWAGWRTRGWPIVTFSRGEVVAQEGRLAARHGRGRYLHRMLT